jgi:hypothetical protein
VQEAHRIRKRILWNAGRDALRRAGLCGAAFGRCPSRGDDTRTVLARCRESVRDDTVLSPVASAHTDDRDRGHLCLDAQVQGVVSVMRIELATQNPQAVFLGLLTHHQIQVVLGMRL